MDSAQTYSDPYRTEVAHIHLTDAQVRFAAVSNVSYALHLNLAKGTRYSGRMTITFDCNSTAQDIWLDFTADSILYFAVNNNASTPNWEHSKLHLAGLTQGKNIVAVHFVNKYSHDGTGIHHFTDVADGEEYIYTQFEAPYAHIAFPCFDQPDIKATLDLTVVAPAYWKVIANERGEAKAWHRVSNPIDDILGEGDFKLHTFRQTKRISTYLFAVCAGPYAEWRMDTNDVGIPLGIYCRQSLAKYCTPDRVFRWTVNGFLFYTQFFGVPYPFGKYDQVYVPEFKFGAMENIGCVTYRDEYVFRDEPSAVLLARVCNTFLHEMAHMWFGNLVTMKWWDDLWLNESFATYISHVCQARQLTSEFPTIWNDFLSGKGWGYSTDQMSITHPISVSINHTGETETIFDGISYSKGSSVLKQLHYIIGDNVFKAALQEYIQTNQFANTAYQDLISVISKHAKKAGIPINIEEWSDLWVKAAGLNQLEAEFQVSNGKISRFIIKQSAVLAEHPTLRPHQIQVDMYGPDMRVVWSGPLIVQPKAETEYAELVGKPAPSCVLLNAEDHDFVKVVVDPVSLPFLQTRLISIPSSLTKQVIIRAIWDMVRDARYSGVEFVDLVIGLLKEETELTVCNYLLELVSGAIMYYLPGGMAKKAYSSKVFAVVLERMKRSQSQSETIIFQRKLISLLCHPYDIFRAKEWLETGDTGIPYFTLGQNDRWNILAAYSAISPSARDLIAQELTRDNTSAGRNFALMCEARSHDPSIKETVWRRLTEQTTKYSNYELEYMSRGFNHWSQIWLLHPYFYQYPQMVLRLMKTVDKELGAIVAEGLVPAFAEDELVIEMLQDLKPQISKERVDINRMIDEEIDQLKRLSKGRALSYRRLYSLA